MDLRVPVVEKNITVLFCDGHKMEGNAFIPASSPDHNGAMRIGEWLNTSDAYFPFLPHGSSSPIIIGKHNIITATAEHETEDNFDESKLSPKCRIRLELKDIGLEGALVMDMPENRLRVLDVLNYDHRFLFLIRNDHEVHVNKDFILRVIEVKDN